MSTTISVPPGLEDRFLEPEGWRWHHFKSGERKLRFGSVFPKDKIPDAVIVCLPGLSEYCEKYFETARDMLAQNYAFWVFDWMGQGLSDRYIENDQRRHSVSFEQDVDDLHELILGYIKHSSVHPDVGRIPLVMIAHSMGGTIGLRYLDKYPEIFECAIFSAPMVGIKALRNIPKFIRIFILWIVSLFAGKSYIPGGAEWNEEGRGTPGADSFSNDPVRGAIHDLWLLKNPVLRIGNATFKWLYNASKACASLEKIKTLKSIETHCVFVSAGQETLVDNKAIKRVSQRMPNASLIEIPEANHEILMEKDEIRNQFLSALNQLVKERVINRPETLKPF